MFEFMADWPVAAQAATAGFVSFFAALVVWTVGHVVIRYLIVAPPDLLESLYALIFAGPPTPTGGRARTRVGAHSHMRVRSVMDADTAVIPTLVDWHERISKT